MVLVLVAVVLVGGAGRGGGGAARLWARRVRGAAAAVVAVTVLRRSPALQAAAWAPGPAGAAARHRGWDKAIFTFATRPVPLNNKEMPHVSCKGEARQ